MDFELSQHELCRAVEYWINTVAMKQKIRVDKIEPNKANATGPLHVKIITKLDTGEVDGPEKASEE
jgi:hypothetical protein